MSFALLQPFEEVFVGWIPSHLRGFKCQQYTSFQKFVPLVSTDLQFTDFHLHSKISLLNFHARTSHQVCILADDVIHKFTLDVNSFSSWLSWWHTSYELKIFIEFCWLNFHKNLKIERFLTKNLEKRMKFSVANRYMTFIIHIIFISVSTKFLICLPKFSYIKMTLPQRKVSHS